MRLKTDCNFNCKYRPFLEDCIYLKSVFLENGKEYVVCNKEKRIKDELETPLTNNTERPQQLPNIHFVYKEEEKYEDFVLEKPFKDRSATKLQYEEPAQQQYNPTQMNLPFDDFMSIKDYYSQIRASKFYEIGKGKTVEIIKVEIVNNKIILLYKESTEKTISPYHIVYLKFEDGKLSLHSDIPFSNLNGANNSFNERTNLYLMRENRYRNN